MMPGVRREEEDRRGEQADVDLAGRLQRAEVDLLDHAEDRVAGVAALLLGQPEQRLVLAVGVAASTGSAESATAGSVK